MTNRRDFLRAALSASAAGAALALPPAIRRALAIPAHRRTGTIADVEHVVILMQENRSFDHYFGTLSGVRGFGGRFPIPVIDAPGIANRTVWFQSNGGTGPGPAVVAPFRLDTRASFALMRVTGTPHTWPNAQGAWSDGRLHQWPMFKTDRSMGYFTREDIPFQFALAEAFTLCDAYHCSFHGGTNPNRLFHWTGTHDPRGTAGGPGLTNDFDRLEHDPAGGYTWMTYPERLQAAGVSWQIYQNMADNFGDNPLAGFRRYRDAVAGRPGALAALRDRGLSTRDLDLLADDVLHDRLPQVAWIVATEEGSEHPDSSSPAQGAAYTARVLEALTANPAVWSRTVLLVNFDENDGFFDHVPPPAPPSVASADPVVLAGGSTVDTAGEYHEVLPIGVDPTKICGCSGRAGFIATSRAARSPRPPLPRSTRRTCAAIWSSRCTTAGPCRSSWCCERTRTPARSTAWSCRSGRTGCAAGRWSAARTGTTSPSRPAGCRASSGGSPAGSRPAATR